MANSMHSETWFLCPHCDLTCKLPRLQPGTKACCPRCHTTLKQAWSDPHLRPQLYALSALVMLVLANLFPFIGMNVSGLSNQITLWQIPSAMFTDNYRSLATFFLVFVEGIPALALLIILVLVTQRRQPSQAMRPLAKLFFLMREWGMAEIFMVGILVSFVKLMAYGTINLGLSFWPWCLFCILQLKAFQATDRRDIWRWIDQEPELSCVPQAGISGLRQNLRSCSCCAAIVSADKPTCPRCYTVGYARKRQSLQWTLALLLTSLILYLPANMMPIMVTEVLGSPTNSTIMAGVVLLWSEGSYPIALVIFIASVMVPSLKMVAIVWLTWNASGRGKRDNQRMHLLYEVVEFVGRWSMIDVFVIAILAALVRIGGLMNVYPAEGAILFALVVILTMLSSKAFDPRLLWDRENHHFSKETKLESE